MTERPDIPPNDVDRPEPIEEGLDPANQSLADALHVSFWILKAIMLLLAVAFLGWSRHSGFFTVPPQQKALVLRFGAVKGEGIPKDSGKHWSWPYPIDSRRMVDVRVKSFEIETFYFSRTAHDRTKTLDDLGPRRGALEPGKDGCLISGDRNLLHALWSIEYQVSNVREYLETVTDEAGLVKAVLDNAVVRTVARFRADDLLSDRITEIQAEVAARADERLSALKSGISVVSVNVKMPTPPLQVRRAFLEVNEAVSEADQKVLKAQQAADRILNDMAGAAHEGLAAAIARYGDARARKDQAAAGRIQAKIDTLLLSDDTKGQAGEMMDRARSYKTNLIQVVRAEADYFRRLRSQYKENPDIVKQRLWENTRQRMMQDAESKVFLPRGEPLIVDINKPPRWDREEQKAKLEAVGRRAR